MTRDDLAIRRQELGRIRQISLRDNSLPAAHEQLGRSLGVVIRDVARQRRSVTSDATFVREIGILRQARTRIDALSKQRKIARPLRAGLAEYAECLEAWARGARLERVAKWGATPGPMVSAADLAFWLQDDNTGCQTGMIRVDGGAVLFWHTEEDTIGYFDRPRLATFATGAETRCAFLYPYLLPGPAFGWSSGAFHALDSLHTRRPATGNAIPSCVAAWLVWRLADQLSLREIVRPLGPFLDGCAVHVVARRAGQVTVESVEFGGNQLVARHLPRRPGCWDFQGNAVRRPTGKLARLEALSGAERGKYERRRDRTAAAAARWLAAGGATPPRVLGLLATRHGGSYGYANRDVMAYCVGRADAEHMEIHVESGPALPSDVYQPQFHA